MAQPEKISSCTRLSFLLVSFYYSLIITALEAVFYFHGENTYHLQT